MSAGTAQVFVVLLADVGSRAVTEVLALCDIASPSPRWRRHAQNLLTVRPHAPSSDLQSRLEGHPAVARVIALRGTRLFAHWPNGTPRAVGLGNGASFCGSSPVVIAGPCSVEGSQQVLEIAEAVAEAGAHALRGGVFKPRTSPYDFAGLGEPGLHMLVQASRRTGLPIVTEVLDAGCLDLLAQHADMLQIGSRNMHNPPLLFAVGAHPRGRPVLLKRGLGATVDELLEAAEYVLLGRLAGGHAEPGLVLCERGIRTFETSTRFTLDVAALPVLARKTHLPVIVDPSHAAGERGLVPALAAAGIAAGARGLIVEVHGEPEKAWCDGPQSLDFAAFRALMAAVNLSHNTGAARGI